MKIYINGLETDYSVSSNGLVLNRKTQRLLQGSPDKRGYVTVSIRSSSKMYTKLVHRLVAGAFIPNPENKPTVNHIDGNKSNNDLSNLEWATHKENINHAISTGLRNTSGINAPSNIYSEEIVHKVCKLLEASKSPKEISELLGVSTNLPNRIKYLGKWKEISHKYNIPKTRKLSYSTKNKVLDLFRAGIYDYDELLKRLGLPDTVHSRKYLYGVKWQFKRVQGSSTIEH